MPTNFVKTTETQNPEIAVNQLSYDTGLQGLAESLTSGIEALSQMRQERQKAEAMAGFEEAVFGLEEEKAIARGQIAKGFLNVLQYRYQRVPVPMMPKKYPLQSLLLLHFSPPDPGLTWKWKDP